MKKIILITLVAVGVTSAACRKERTCTCNTTTTRVTSNNGVTLTNVTTSSEKITKSKQLKHEFIQSSGCISNSYTDLSNNGNTQTTYVTSCDLK